MSCRINERIQRVELYLVGFGQRTVRSAGVRRLRIGWRQKPLVTQTVSYPSASARWATLTMFSALAAGPRLGILNPSRMATPPRIAGRHRRKHAPSLMLVALAESSQRVSENA